MNRSLLSLAAAAVMAPLSLAAQQVQDPPGAKYLCRDSSYSTASQNACSDHGGVARAATGRSTQAGRSPVARPSRTPARRGARTAAPSRDSVARRDSTPTRGLPPLNSSAPRDSAAGRDSVTRRDTTPQNRPRPDSIPARTRPLDRDTMQAHPVIPDTTRSTDALPHLQRDTMPRFVGDDSTSPPDTTHMPADTTRIPRDTTRATRDTTRTMTQTSPLPPDTTQQRTRAQRDSTQAGVSARSANTGAPTDATAQCKDGTYTNTRTRNNACARHGGVDKWLREP